MGDGGEDRFSVTLPARAGLVGTIRVFASAVARHYGLADEIVEDVKLAVSEACTDPIDAGAGGDVTIVLVDDGPASIGSVQASETASLTSSTISSASP